MGTDEALDAVKLFKATVDDIRSVESGVITSNDLLANTAKDSKRILDEAKSETISKFITNITGNNPGVLAPGEVYPQLTSIFNSKTAITDIKNLMSRVDEAGDPLLKEALQAQYLRQMMRLLHRESKT